MKVKFALFSTILLSALSLPNPSFAQSFPTCVSNDSDSDGDGYGWENDDTCLVDVNGGTVLVGQCEDRGGFPWGWNPVTESSCRLDEQTQDTQVDSESIEDMLTGTWFCQNQYTVNVELGDTSGSMLLNPAGFMWSNYEFSVSGANPLQTSDRKRLVFHSDHSVEVTNVYIYNENDLPRNRPLLEQDVESWPTGGEWIEQVSYGNWAIRNFRLEIYGRDSYIANVSRGSTGIHFSSAGNMPALYIYRGGSRRYECLMQ